MLAYLWRSIGVESPRHEQTPVDPAKDLVVVSDKERDDDDFCEISVRPMTWAEVASGAINRDNSFPKVVLTTRRLSMNSVSSSPYDYNDSPPRPVVKSSAWESNELYGDLEDNYESIIERRRRRKSFKKKRDTL